MLESAQKRFLGCVFAAETFKGDDTQVKSIGVPCKSYILVFTSAISASAVKSFGSTYFSSLFLSHYVLCSFYLGSGRRQEAIPPRRTHTKRCEDNFQMSCGWPLWVCNLRTHKVVEWDCWVYTVQCARFGHFMVSEVYAVDRIFLIFKVCCLTSVLTSIYSKITCTYVLLN